jgi:hypothetical protein
MTRTLRNLLGATCLLAVVACAVDIAFDMTRDIPVDATGASVNSVVDVDLAQYQVVQDHKGNVQALQLQSVDVKVTAINTTTNKATSVSGTLSLRPFGAIDATQDVAVGTLTAVPIVLLTKVTLPGSAALDAFLLQQIKGDGKFKAVISGSTAGGEAHLTINALMHASMSYGTGL